MKQKIIPADLSPKERHQLIIGSIAPRPIAFVSTIGDGGKHNLAPYSFFNAFSSTPPIVVFSSNRRVRDNTTKDTLINVQKNRGLVINVVSYDVVRQMTLTSVEFPSDISEFTKAGFTPEPSTIVSAPCVKESPINMECRVNDIIRLGEKGGAGHLIICEVLAMHVDENIIDENNRIDPHKVDLMGRLGRSYYTRASGDAVSTIYQNVLEPILGFDGLPEHIVKSEVLTGNQIAEMAALHELPGQELQDAVKAKYPENREKVAAELIAIGKAEEALALLI
ncbi:MAG: flavin reductase family protein [Saprospiraceae bacterium]|nr:flavin reductase family protein [Saprospiraceae bacterium]